MSTPKLRKLKLATVAQPSAGKGPWGLRACVVGFCLSVKEGPGKRRGSVVEAELGLANCCRASTNEKNLTGQGIPKFGSKL